MISMSRQVWRVHFWHLHSNRTLRARLGATRTSFGGSSARTRTWLSRHLNSRLPVEAFGIAASLASTSLITYPNRKRTRGLYRGVLKTHKCLEWTWSSSKRRKRRWLHDVPIGLGAPRWLSKQAVGMLLRNRHWTISQSAMYMPEQNGIGSPTWAHML